MREFIQTSDNCWLDKETMHFIHPSRVKESCIIERPKFYWLTDYEREYHEDYVSPNGVKSRRIFKGVYKFSLNNLTLRLNGILTSANLSWTDRNFGTGIGKIDMDYSYPLDKEEFSWSVNGGIEQDFSRFFETSWRFQRIEGLGTAKVYGIPYSKFPFGLAPFPLDVSYKLTPIGKYFVFMFGHWAIILEDDLSFSAVVILDRTSAKGIDILKFIYAINPRLVKAQMFIE